MAETVPASRDELLQHLEQLSGRSLRTRADLDAYLTELRARKLGPQPTRAQRRWSALKHATLGVGLLIAVLQYYLIDIYVQILSLQRVQFLTPDVLPVQHPIQRSVLDLLSYFC